MLRPQCLLIYCQRTLVGRLDTEEARNGFHEARQKVLRSREEILLIGSEQVVSHVETLFMDVFTLKPGDAEDSQQRVLDLHDSFVKAVRDELGVSEDRIGRQVHRRGTHRTGDSSS